MNINPYEFEKAHDGDLFVKKGEKLVAVSFNELSKELKNNEKVVKTTFFYKKYFFYHISIIN